MLDNSLFIRHIKSIKNSKVETYVFVVSLFFYLLLWTFNPGNKIIAASFLFLIFIYHYRLKNIRLSLLFAYLASGVVFTGKRYLIELIPPGFFPEEVFPQGHVLFFVISPKHILIFLIFLFLVRDLIKGKFQKFAVTSVDVIVFFYFVWAILSDFFGSIRPEVSLLFSLSGLDVFILYLVLRSYRTKGAKFLRVFLALYSSLVVFESLISFQQFRGSSPVFKNLETQVDIEFFGNVADEPQFRFRPIGTFSHANELGMWLSFWLPVIFARLFRKSENLFVISLILGVTTLVLTLSRSSWIGFGVSILFIIFVLEKVKRAKFPQILTKHFFLISLLSLFLAVLFIFPRLEKSLYTFTEGGGYLRYLQVQDSFGLIARNPILGVGSGMDILAGLTTNPSSVFSAVALSVHNWYLLTAVVHGMPALILFVSFLVIWLRRRMGLLFANKMIKEADFIGLGFIGGIYSLIIVGFFQPFIGLDLMLLSFAILGSNNGGASRKN